MEINRVNLDPENFLSDSVYIICDGKLVIKEENMTKVKTEIKYRIIYLGKEGEQRMRIAPYTAENDSDHTIKSDTLIKKVYRSCPLCDKIHEVEERKRITTISLKGEEISYEERFYFCPDADEDENEFETGSMINENLFNARKAYLTKMSI